MPPRQIRRNLAAALHTPSVRKSLAPSPLFNESIVALDSQLSTISAQGLEVEHRFVNSLHHHVAQLDCICARLGTTRCREGLFRAYAYGHDDVVSSLRMLSNGTLPGPAQTFCTAFGPVGVCADER